MHVVEECGGVCRDHNGHERSIGGSSEEINSDDIHLDCNTLASPEKGCFEEIPHRLMEKLLGTKEIEN